MTSKSMQSTPVTQDNKPKLKLKAASNLTLPLLSMAHLKTLTIKALSEPYLATDITGLGKETKTTPTVIKVINLDDDSEGLLIINTIIASAFSKVEGGIVGKYFALRGGDIRDGKKYRDITVTLMEVDES